MDYTNLLHKITQPIGQVPIIKSGQTVRVHARIIEGNKERIQIFEGLVIGVKGSGVNKTFTARKIASGVGVERIWPVFSSRIDKIEVVRQAKVRRAKLNFVRGLTKKQSRFKERFAEVIMEGVEKNENETEISSEVEKKTGETEVKEDSASGIETAKDKKQEIAADITKEEVVKKEADKSKEEHLDKDLDKKEEKGNIEKREEGVDKKKKEKEKAKDVGDSQSASGN